MGGQVEKQRQIIHPHPEPNQCNRIQYYATQYNLMEHNTTQTQNNTTLYYAMQNNPIQYVYMSACPFYAHRGMVGLQQI